jgi:uncharacterized damage-inducible protein DinB
MKDHFIKLFNYDKYNNQQISRLIIEAWNPEKPVQLMAHLLGAQQVWLKRCNNAKTIGGAIWPDWQSDVFEQTIEENHKGWITFLETLTPADMDRIIHYQDSKGNNHQNKLIDVLTHVANHGTHHRAQIGQHLKLSGTALPVTDYIAYIRYFGN